MVLGSLEYALSEHNITLCSGTKCEHSLCCNDVKILARNATECLLTGGDCLHGVSIYSKDFTVPVNVV